MRIQSFPGLRKPLPGKQQARFKGQKTFTQTELEAAFAQMKRERQQEATDAQRVAKRFGELVGLKEDSVGAQKLDSFCWGTPNPAQPDIYVISIPYCEYDPGPTGVKDSWLKKVPGLKALPNITKTFQDQNAFEWDISNEPTLKDVKQRTFTVWFNFYGAHEGGY